MASPAKRALKRWRRFTREHAGLIEQGARPEILAEHRRSETRLDPMLFALVYLSKHLVDVSTERVSLSNIHVSWAESAKRWAARSLEPMQDRRAEVAPRETGKSTWWFLLLPMWAAAHNHVGFAAAFADTDTQAQTHLATFKSQLDNNALIREDFPDLVRPKTRGRGTIEADRVSLYHAKSGFVFAAAGMDSSNLGMKVDDKRPDLIILDDIEPHEGRYGKELARKRLDTLISAILPLNIYAHVILAGTVTMAGSIVHQLVQRGRGDDTDENDWVDEQRIEVRHTLPFVTNDEGHRVSIWPEKWPTDWLKSIEGSAQYAKNYANDPLGAEGDYWTFDDVARARALGRVPGATRVLIEVDPAVTQKKTSDFTGIAVIAWTPPPRETPRAPGKVTVLEVRQVKKSGAEIRLDLLDTINRHNAGAVRVETNQGGDLWQAAFWGLPVKVITTHETDSKEVRAATALNHYQRGRVGHAPDFEHAGKKYSLADYEGQLVAFPRAPHDDMVDAADAGIIYFLDRAKRRGPKVGGSTAAYT